MAARYSIPCPTCRHLIGVGRHVDPASGEPAESSPWRDPAPGDATVCGACGELLMFADSRTLVLMPPEHYERVLREVGMPTIARLMEMVRAVHEGKTRQ